MKVWCITAIVCILQLTINGQKVNYDIKDFYTFKNEIGINFTNVLGNVLSLNPNNANSPYGFSYRRHMGNTSLRSAFNVDITNKAEDDFNSGSFIRRSLKILNLNFRIGVEKHLVLSKRMMFSYGIDLLAAYGNENSEIEDFSFSSGGTTFVSKENTIGGGAGPVIRLEYKISDRLFLSTESSLYGFYSTKKESLVINGTPSDEPTTNNSSLKLELPQSLFFNISF